MKTKDCAIVREYMLLTDFQKTVRVLKVKKDSVKAEVMEHLTGKRFFKTGNIIEITESDLKEKYFSFCY